MSSLGQRKGACGHIMANFDKHSRCARCRDKGHGEDPCIKNLQCEFCDLLTPEQIVQLSTPTYKLRKEKQKGKDVLIDPNAVTVISHVEQEVVDRPASHNSSVDLSLPAPSFQKELLDLDEKWSLRMARLEALITMGHKSSPPQPAFSPVKVPVSHQPPPGSISQTPFLQSAALSGQAGPASGPDGAQALPVSTVTRSSPLDNLYPDNDPEPVFQQPGPVPATQSSTGQVLFSARDSIPPDQTEEGELSDPEQEPEDPQDSDSGEKDKIISEDQNYRETVRGVRAFMGWTHIPDLEYSPTSRTDNPWTGHRSQPVGKVSVLLPPEDWLCKKLENMNLVLLEGYPSKSSEPGGLHMDQFLRPPKSQSRWYGIHPAEPKDPSRPGKYVNTWPNDAAKINSAFPRIAKQSVANSQPTVRPLPQDTVRKWEKSAKESSYICNQAAGFNRCITKLQDSVQEQVRILHHEMGKGKSSAKAQAALDELHYLTTFNQNVSFAMGKSLQHLSDFTFTQMANLTLVRRDSYLEHLKPGVKPDTFASLRNCSLNGYALFPDAIIRKAEDDITQHEAAKRTSQPGPGHGGFAGAQKRGQNRYQPYSTGWRNQDTSKPSGNSGKDMPAWKSFGGRGRPRGRGRGGPANRGSRGSKDVHPYK